jgi:hypothetical protein
MGRLIPAPEHQVQIYFGLEDKEMKQQIKVNVPILDEDKF